ncbi:MAG TPA: hypothetical protein GX509_06195 [Firmicutes bacterium]|nr:hypothetical protein [Bacillota bacterium]HHY98311.1 hypothetical protein [Bacillota bacterium]
MSRSRFVVEVIESALKRRRCFDAVKGLQDMLPADDVPHWRDDASIDKWLSDNRNADRKASEEKWEI